MEADQQYILNLFDFFWYGNGVFPENQPKSEPISVPEEPETHSLFRIQTLHRSQSHELLSFKDSFSSDSLSPISVLSNPKLETILSGKESENFAESGENRKPKKGLNELGQRRGRGRRQGNSRSLSELEFEELKGFMDLGFVFSEEDKNSSLVSILPGLQRLGQEISNGDAAAAADDEDEFEEEMEIDEGEIHRPYLSEAWGVLIDKNRENPLMNWRIPHLSGNEMVIKDHLRMWAQTVASTVR